MQFLVHIAVILLNYFSVEYFLLHRTLHLWKKYLINLVQGGLGMVKERVRETLATMSPSFQVIGRWLLENYDSIGFTSVHELSKSIGVSKRLSGALYAGAGIKGYKQFRETVQDEVKTKLKKRS